MQIAFAEELVTIDPSMEKIAWGWAKRMGRKAWGGIKSVGRWAKNNPLDAALTATMFIPGLNVVGGLARGGLLAARAANAGRKAYKTSQLASKGLQSINKFKQLRAGGASLQQAARAVPGAGNAAKLTNQARRLSGQANQLRQRSRAAFSSANPLNRGGMGYGRYTPGNSFSAIGKGGPLWKGGRFLKAGPQVGGKTRQALRLGGTAIGAQGVYSAATGNSALGSMQNWKAAPTAGRAGAGNTRQGGAQWSQTIQNLRQR